MQYLMCTPLVLGESKTNMTQFKKQQLILILENEAYACVQEYIGWWDFLIYYLDSNKADSLLYHIGWESECRLQNNACSCICHSHSD